MARYVYEGPAPETDPGGSMVRPGDVRDHDAAPDWGAWRLVADPADGPVPVAVQLAAGVPPEDTVTIADQKAGADLPPALNVNSPEA